MPARTFNLDQAREIGDQLRIDWSAVDIEQFRIGLDVELEHGRRDPETDVTHERSEHHGEDCARSSPRVP